MEIPFGLCDTDTMNDETIRQRVRRFRKQQNLTQDELAHEIGMSGRTVSNWERGEETPSANAARALAAFFGVTTDYFLSPADRALESVIEQAVGNVAPIDEREQRALKIIAQLRADPQLFEIWIRDGERLTGGTI